MATKLQTIDDQIETLKRRRAAVRAREAARERKRDTRRKILLGAELVKLVGDGDEPAAALYRRIRATVAVGRNAAVFEGWEPTAGGGAS